MFDVKAFVSGMEVINSGLIHIVGNTATLIVDGLHVDIVFVDDSGGQRWSTFVVGSKLELRLYNLNSTFPEGRIEPISIASSDRGEVMLTFLVNVVDKEKSLRGFSYTVLLGPKVNG